MTRDELFVWVDAHSAGEESAEIIKAAIDRYSSALISKKDTISCRCGSCCDCLDIRIGDIVERRGDDGKMYEYEVSDITASKQTMYIGADNAYPEFVFINCDDCSVVQRNNR